MLLVAFTLTSCTDSEDVQVSYETPTGITAAHIFDDYQQFIDGDFDMTKDNWKVNLKVLIYDQKGILVDKKEKMSSVLSDSLIFKPILSPGEYTVISIADFREGLGGKDFKYWEISNESKLQDLSITENMVDYTTPFETLGVDVQKITVDNDPVSINADIKPVTCLVQVFTSDGDYQGGGFNGFSRFASVVGGYTLRSIKSKNNVRFENGNPIFKYSEQQSDYLLGTSAVAKKMNDKLAPTSYRYRALLPEENKAFSYHIQRVKNMPEDMYNEFIEYCGDFEDDGISNVLPEISSNKQYVVNMILDVMQLTAVQLTPDFTHDSFTRNFVEKYNKELIYQMVNRNYESVLGKDENYVNVFLNRIPESRETSPSFVSYYPFSRCDRFESMVGAQFETAEFDKCIAVIVNLRNESDEIYNYTKECLSERFVLEEEAGGKFGPDIVSYLEKGKDPENSRFRVAFRKLRNDKGEVILYALQIVLRVPAQQQAKINNMPSIRYFGKNYPLLSLDDLAKFME